MVVADSIEVVIARNVEGDVILVGDHSAARISCPEPTARDTVVAHEHIYGVARIKLHKAPEGPATQSMADKTLLRLKEGQFVSYIELIRVAVVFRASAVRQLRQRIRDVVVRCSAG